MHRAAVCVTKGVANDLGYRCGQARLLGGVKLEESRNLCGALSRRDDILIVVKGEREQ